MNIPARPLRRHTIVDTVHVVTESPLKSPTETPQVCFPLNATFSPVHLRSHTTSAVALFLGSEVGLMSRRVELAIRCLLAGAGFWRICYLGVPRYPRWEKLLTSRTRATRACCSRWRLVLRRSSVAGALAGGTSSARAARPANFVLRGRLIAGTVEGVLFAAGTSGPLSYISVMILV